MSRRNFYRDPGYQWPGRRDEDWDRKAWDREHWERWMDTVRSNQRDPDESYGSVGGTPYEGGVFSSGTYGGGAEFYSVTGMYENPLLDKTRATHHGKGPKGYKRSDERIHDEICERLTRHPLVDASLVEVHVQNGEVTLTGEVLDRRMKHLTEDQTGRGEFGSQLLDVVKPVLLRAMQVAVNAGKREVRKKIVRGGGGIGTQFRLPSSFAGKTRWTFM